MYLLCRMQSEIDKMWYSVIVKAQLSYCNSIYNYHCRIERNNLAENYGEMTAYSKKAILIVPSIRRKVTIHKVENEPPNK